jgi:hypothetical protein
MTWFRRATPTATVTTTAADDAGGDVDELDGFLSAIEAQTPQEARARAEDAWLRRRHEAAVNAFVRESLPVESAPSTRAIDARPMSPPPTMALHRDQLLEPDRLARRLSAMLSVLLWQRTMQRDSRPLAVLPSSMPPPPAPPPPPPQLPSSSSSFFASRMKSFIDVYGDGSEFAMPSRDGGGDGDIEIVDNTDRDWLASQRSSTIAGAWWDKTE